MNFWEKRLKFQCLGVSLLVSWLFAFKICFESSGLFHKLFPFHVAFQSSVSKIFLLYFDDINHQNFCYPTILLRPHSKLTLKQHEKIVLENQNQYHRSVCCRMITSILSSHFFVFLINVHKFRYKTTCGYVDRCWGSCVIFFLFTAQDLILRLKVLRHLM